MVHVKLLRVNFATQFRYGIFTHSVIAIGIWGITPGWEKLSIPFLAVAGWRQRHWQEDSKSFMLICLYKNIFPVI